MFQYLNRHLSGVSIVEWFICLLILIRLLYHLAKQRGKTGEIIGHEESIRLMNQSRSLKTIPSAPWIPILGSLPFLGRYPERTIATWGQEKGYGSVFRVRFGTMNAIILNDLEAVRDGFVRKGHRICGRPQNPFFQEMTEGNGILFIDYGTKWRNQRKFGHSAFRKIGFNDRIDRIAEKETQMLVQALEKQLFGECIQEEYLCGNYKRLQTDNTTSSMPDFNNNNDGWKVVDPKAFMHKATANVMCSILFGRSFGKDDAEYNAVLEETPIQARKSAAFFMLVFLVPSLRNMPPIRGVIDEALCLRKATLKMIRELVDEHVANFTGLKTEADFIDCFLDELAGEVTSNDADGIAFKNFYENANSDLTRDQLSTYALDIFTAGAEATADSILWTLLYLAKDPKLQAEIREEIIAIGGEDKFPSVKLMSKMHLMKATVHETVRIRPINTLGIAHTASRRCEVMGFDVPKDSIVMANFWGVHHNPKVFPNPDIFHAQRHIDDVGEFVPSKHVIAFSMGPRQCLGKKIAEIIQRSVLTNIVRNFEFRLPRTWQSDKNCYTTAEPDMNGKNGHVLLPPEYKLEWKMVA